MKKNIVRLIVIMLLAITMIFLTSCGWNTTDNNSADTNNSPFVTLDGETVCGNSSTNVYVYDKYTYIVYYLFSNYQYSIVEDGHTFTYFSPYINENGKYCRYDPQTDTITEIN